MFLRKDYVPLVSSKLVNVQQYLCRKDNLTLTLTITITLTLKRDLPCGSAGKESACNAGDLGLIPGVGRSPGEGKGYALQYSGLENSMNYTVQRVRHD